MAPIFSKILQPIVLALIAAGPAAAATCGGGGSYDVSDVQANFGNQVIGPKTALTFNQGSAQICIVNRAPQTAVSLSGGQINDAIATVENGCCGGSETCAGGQQQITSTSNNVIDLSVQAEGQNCSA